MEKKIDWIGVNETLNVVIEASRVGDEFILENQRTWKVEKKDLVSLALVNKEASQPVCKNCGNDRNDKFKPYPYLGEHTYQCAVCSEMTTVKEVVSRRVITVLINNSLRKRQEIAGRMERTLNDY
ncbi:MAG: hypothetical protein WC458_03495 [Patescibacteria group bacterium]